MKFDTLVVKFVFFVYSKSTNRKNYKALQLIGNATYDRKRHLQFIKLRLNIQGNSNEYTTQPILTRPSLDAFRPFGLISRARPAQAKGAH